MITKMEVKVNSLNFFKQDQRLQHNLASHYEKGKLIEMKYYGFKTNI